MITHLYMNGDYEAPWALDQVFEYKVRFQILVDTDAQVDYLFALQLMYGRELEVITWSDWHVLKRTLLPIWFSRTPISTWEI